MFIGDARGLALCEGVSGDGVGMFLVQAARALAEKVVAITGSNLLLIARNGGGLWCVGLLDSTGHSDTHGVIRIERIYPV